MPWDTRMDLHLDVAASYGRVLLTSAADSSLLNVPPDMVSGDALTVRIHFWTRGTTPGTLDIADPGSGSVIRFSARPADVPEGSDLLFLATGFTQLSPGIWEASLDLATAELAAHLAASPAGAKRILGEIEVTVSGRTRSLQFDLNARPQVYDDQDAPTALPTPEAWLGTALLGATAPTNTTVAGVAATATITLTDNPAAGGTITIAGLTYYLAPLTGPATPRDIGAPFPSASATTWAAAIANRINTWSGGGYDPNVSATSSGGVVTLTARSTGTAGNAITLAESATNLTVSGATLTGGVTAVNPTATPPYLRVHGGFLYIQEAGVWKKVALSAL